MTERTDPELAAPDPVEGESAADIEMTPDELPEPGRSAAPLPEAEAPTSGDAAPQPDAVGDARQRAAWGSPAEDLPPAGPTLSFGFNQGRVPGQGEDSDPILRDGRELGLVGVFDGMGGAGGTVYDTPDGPRTGAYLASRIARDVVEQRMLALLDPEWNLDGAGSARDLQRHVQEALQAALAGLDAPKSGLRSRLLRALPTTMALLALQRREPQSGRWAAHVFWSGDSRVYVFDSDQGAAQLSRDDLRDAGDAMVNLRQDSVVSNAMSADTDFVVHHRRVDLRAPFLAVAATDGCFGYVRTPIHFEHLVLATLRDSTDTESWSSALQERISAITGDDAAMAVLGIGADHEEFQRLFAARTADLEQRCLIPLDEVEADVRRAEQAVAEARRRHSQLQTALWSQYKVDYERYLTREEGR